MSPSENRNTTPPTPLGLLIAWKCDFTPGTTQCPPISQLRILFSEEKSLNSTLRTLYDNQRKINIMFWFPNKQTIKANPLNNTYHSLQTIHTRQITPRSEENSFASYPKNILKVIECLFPRVNSGCFRLLRVGHPPNHCGQKIKKVETKIIFLFILKVAPYHLAQRLNVCVDVCDRARIGGGGRVG